jgi:alkylhydroperoxidase family enzyme
MVSREQQTRVFLVAILLLAWFHLPTRAAEPPAKPRFPALSNREAWDRLPRQDPPLPAWARILAGSLPQTTAAMLKLDHLHRVRNPLDARLRGKLRWVAAQEIGCDYSKRQAEGDLRRAGLSEQEVKKLGDLEGLPEAERTALEFARKLTRAASTVTDEEMAHLLEQHGPEQVVAMVHTLAHANFQDRIFLALGVKVEAGGPLPPLDIRFDPMNKPRLPAPKRPPWEKITEAKLTVPRVKVDWVEHDFASLQGLLEGQKKRRARIPMPGPEQLARLSAEQRKRYPGIVWSRVSMGYQPALTQAWFACMRTFQRETDLDPIFANT